MSNVNGQSYSLTVLTPVLIARESALRSELEALPKGEGSPLARVGGVHLGRWVMIDQLPYQGEPQPRDRLSSAYLLFSVEFDGALGPFLERMRERMGSDADAIWGYCMNYPGSAERDAFADYLRRHQVNSGFSVVGYPEATVGDVREALALRERLAAFVLDAQAMTAPALLAAWRAWRAR